MTLVIAMDWGSINYIISDARQSNAVGDGANNVVKTGIFFDGCIFGLVGNPDSGKEFMRSFLEVLSAHPQPNIGANWSFFCQFIEGYNFDKSKSARFEIILSERTSGQPKFHCLKSSEGEIRSLTEPEDGKAALTAFGSGASLFQHEIEHKIVPRMEDFFERCYTQGRSTEDTILVLRYLVCLWLNELTYGPHRHEIEAKRVGGLFNFVGQDQRKEKRQPTATYIITEISDDGWKAVTQTRVNRVVPLDTGLAFQYYTSNGKNDKPGIFVCDYLLSDCPMNERTDVEKRNFEAECNQMLGESGFCDFGYTKREHQIEDFFEVDSRLQEFVTDDGAPRDYLRQQIAKVILISRKNRNDALR